MAKEQGLSLNPTKISGVCGRLMCCLKHEQDVYEEKLSRLPNIGAIVKTVDGQGVVEDVQLLKELITVKVEKEDSISKKIYPFKEIEIIKNAHKKESKSEEIDKKEIKKLEEGFSRQENI